MQGRTRLSAKAAQVMEVKGAWTRTYQTTTVDPDSHREVGSVRDTRRPDHVEIQAIFRDRVAHVVTAIADAVRRVFRGVADTLPGRVQVLGDCETRRHLLAALTLFMLMATLEDGLRTFAYGMPRKKSWLYSGE
jgi:hypothetical protein